MRHITCSMLVLAVACGGPADPPQEEPTDGTEEPIDDETETPTDPPIEPTDDTDPPAEDPCVARGAPVLEIGHGEAAITPYADGETTLVVHGGQGAWHLDLGFRVENVPQAVGYRYTMTEVASGAEIAADDTLNRVYLTPPVLGEPWDCRGRESDIRAVVDWDALRSPGDPDRDQPWELLCGHDVDVAFALEDADGAPLAEASVRLHVQPDPCDCTACGAPSLDCTPGYTGYDVCFPGVRICEVPETTPDDTSDTDHCPDVVP